MKLEKILDFEKEFTDLVNLDLSDTQAAWDLSVALDSVKKATRLFSEKRDALLKKYGEPIEGNPDQYQIHDPDSFNAEVKKLLDVVIDVKFPKIPFTAFEGHKISAAKLSAWRELGIVNMKKS